MLVAGGGAVQQQVGQHHACRAAGGSLGSEAFHHHPTARLLQGLVPARPAARLAWGEVVDAHVGQGGGLALQRLEQLGQGGLGCTVRGVLQRGRDKTASRIERGAPWACRCPPALSQVHGVAQQTRRPQAAALRACGVGEPSEPAPSMLNTVPPPGWRPMAAMAARVASREPSRLVATTRCTCSGGWSSRLCRGTQAGEGGRLGRQHQADSQANPGQGSCLQPHTASQQRAWKEPEAPALLTQQSMRPPSSSRTSATRPSTDAGSLTSQVAPAASRAQVIQN